MPSDLLPSEGIGDLVPDPIPVRPRGSAVPDLTDSGGSTEPGIVPIAGSEPHPARPRGVAFTLCRTLDVAPPPDSVRDIVVPAYSASDVAQPPDFTTDITPPPSCASNVAIVFC